MTTKQDAYASEEETQALLVPDTRAEAERGLAAMMAEREADEQGAEAYPILRQIALDLLESKPTFTGLPKRKLNALLSAGWHINGVSIEREEGGVTKRGAVTAGGMVLWWNSEQPAQQQGWKLVPVEPTREMIAAGSDDLRLGGIIGTLARAGECYRAMLNAAPQPAQAAQPAQPQQEPVDRFKDFPVNDWGEPIIYDTKEIDEITGFLTGDEGEDDSVTVLHNLVRYLNVVHPGKTMTQVLIETEETALAAQQQEPVAWRSWNDHDSYGFWNTKQEAEPWCAPDFFAEPLYTSPPASKPWVGLTDEDIGAACGFAEHTTTSTRFTLMAISRAIETKLREKNT